jgi:hypothetical protein
MASVNDVQAIVTDSLKFTDTATCSIQMTIELSGGAANLLNQLTKLVGKDRGEVIAEALSVLYIGAVVQAEGMNMAVVDKEGKVQTILDLLSKD